jgi:hypothetical protein
VDALALLAALLAHDLMQAGHGWSQHVVEGGRDVAELRVAIGQQQPDRGHAEHPLFRERLGGDLALIGGDFQPCGRTRNMARSGIRDEAAARVLEAVRTADRLDHAALAFDGDEPRRVERHAAEMRAEMNRVQSARLRQHPADQCDAFGRARDRVIDLHADEAPQAGQRIGDRSRCLGRRRRRAGRVAERLRQILRPGRLQQRQDRGEEFRHLIRGGVGTVRRREHEAVGVLSRGHGEEFARRTGGCGHEQHQARAVIRQALARIRGDGGAASHVGFFEPQDNRAFRQGGVDRRRGPADADDAARAGMERDGIDVAGHARHVSVPVAVLFTWARAYARSDASCPRPRTVGVLGA